MDDWNRVAVLARRAADILPEPPAADDLDGYRAWEELVLYAAMRVSAIAGGDGSVATSVGPRSRRRVTWRALLDLASVEPPDADELGRPGPGAVPGDDRRAPLPGH